MKKPTVEEFKEFFIGYFNFAPYKEWKKTTYDKDSVVCYNGLIYKSLIDNNYANPQDINWWEVQVHEYTEETEYKNGNYVLYNGVYYRCIVESSTNVPVMESDWEEVERDVLAEEFGSAWVCLTPVWEEREWEVNSYCYFDGNVYLALETNEEVPNESDKWELVEEKKLKEIFGEYEEFIAPVMYNKLDKVIYINRKKWIREIYISLSDNNFYEPNNKEKWSLSEESLTSYVLDSMIEEAMNEAETIVKPECVTEEKYYRIAFLYMTAHYLIMDWKMKNSGINAGGSAGILIGRTAGKMSAHYAISPIVQQYPQYEFFFKTPEGEKAMNIILKKRIGFFLYTPGTWSDY